ncbi:helix-turn-helix transcriptional regulator [Longimicrobium terrae]|nr:helix-turn-helix transcriptional regulator [Longimicrobium terrae]
MVTNRDEDMLDRVFTALADPTRRAILARLSSGEATVGELAEPFQMSRPAVSKHLDVLQRAGLVHRVADGRVNRCHLDGEPLRDAMQWMETYRTFWEGQLDALARYFDAEDGG